MTPYFKPFNECPSYTQDDADGLSFRKVLSEGIVPDMDAGLVSAIGPTHKYPGIHDFDQIYLIFKGKGYIHLSGERIRIEEPGIVLIPHGTKHSIEVDAGEIMQYVYVNKRLH